MLQTEIALSTTEAEYVALSQAMRDVIPLLQLIEEIGDIFTLLKPSVNVHCKVFEDNNSCIAIAKAPRMNPRTKHIGIKYHHFREYVRRQKLSLFPIDTKEQTADIFTKPLNESLFLYLRNKLMGW